MELYLNRTKRGEQRTNGELYAEFIFLCYTVEDKDREIPGKPVQEWKVDGQTAIPKGRFRITLEDSPKFGPETITINDVPGFTHIRIHGGNDESHTEGCPLAGYTLTEDGKIVPGLSKPAVENLKRVIKESLLIRNDKVFITIL